jgi:hypothetical protein
MFLSLLLPFLAAVHLHAGPPAPVHHAPLAATVRHQPATVRHQAPLVPTTPPAAAARRPTAPRVHVPWVRPPRRPATPPAVDPGPVTYPAPGADVPTGPNGEPIPELPPLSCDDGAACITD